MCVLQMGFLTYPPFFSPGRYGMSHGLKSKGTRAYVIVDYGFTASERERERDRQRETDREGRTCQTRFGTETLPRHLTKNS